jgi:hypothetical protein
VRGGRNLALYLEGFARDGGLSMDEVTSAVSAEQASICIWDGINTMTSGCSQATNILGT